jgi:hypothetical protein
MYFIAYVACAAPKQPLFSQTQPATPYAPLLGAGTSSILLMKPCWKGI